MFIQQQSQNKIYAKIRHGKVLDKDGNEYPGVEGHAIFLDRREEEFEGRKYYRYILGLKTQDPAADTPSILYLDLIEDSSLTESIILKLATWCDWISEYQPLYSDGSPHVEIRLYEIAKESGARRNVASVKVNGEKMYSRYVSSQYLNSLSDKEKEAMKLPPIALPDFKWVEVARGKYVKAEQQARLDFIEKQAAKVDATLRSLSNNF
jgi:hypothetical protein